MADKNKDLGFWARVRKVEGAGCWEWAGSHTTTGYGAFHVAGVGTVRAHRVSWEMHYGPIGAGLFVCHRCDNRQCVRPDHLFLGTSSDNRRDCVAKGRGYTGKRPRGEAAHAAKLTASDVVAIRQRRAAGEKQVVIAADYGVTPENISYIVRGLSWRHVQ